MIYNVSQCLHCFYNVYNGYIVLLYFAIFYIIYDAYNVLYFFIILKPMENGVGSHWVIESPTIC